MFTKTAKGILLLIICLPLIIPFLKPGLPKTHDGIWAVIRLAEMHREVREGQIPPRWAGFLNHGYGYPLFLFTYPLPYYAGEILHAAGFGVVDAMKILFILTIAGSALTFYIFARSVWGIWGALLSTTLYLYAPYRLVNLYTRGSIGELAAGVFFPWLFFG